MHNRYAFYEPPSEREGDHEVVEGANATENSRFLTQKV